MCLSMVHVCKIAYDVYKKYLESQKLYIQVGGNNTNKMSLLTVNRNADI